MICINYYGLITIKWCGGVCTRWTGVRETLVMVWWSMHALDWSKGNFGNGVVECARAGLEQLK